MTSKSKDTRNAARTSAQGHFTASERRDSAFQFEIARERDARDAKNARLRALRIAKETADKAAAEIRAVEEAERKKTARKTRKKPARSEPTAKSIDS